MSRYTPLWPADCGVQVRLQTFPGASSAKHTNASRKTAQLVRCGFRFSASHSEVTPERMCKKRDFARTSIISIIQLRAEFCEITLTKRWRVLEISCSAKKDQIFVSVVFQKIGVLTCQDGYEKCYWVRGFHTAYWCCGYTWIEYNFHSKGIDGFRPEGRKSGVSQAIEEDSILVPWPAGGVNFLSWLAFMADDVLDSERATESSYKQHFFCTIIFDIFFGTRYLYGFFCLFSTYYDGFHDSLISFP